eukprot:scaffold128259_cov22-Tisochrysis_lutea.AAC.2
MDQLRCHLVFTCIPHKPSPAPHTSPARQPASNEYMQGWNSSGSIWISSHEFYPGQACMSLTHCCCPVKQATHKVPIKEADQSRGEDVAAALRLSMTHADLDV